MQDTVKKDTAAWRHLGGDVPAAIGIDIGSTTAKIVVFVDGELVYSCYERHFSQVRPKTLELLMRVEEIVGNRPVRVSISGSAGLGLAKAANIPFVQEVFATGEVIEHLEPDTSVVIELGGEDAKVIFFEGGMDERMNGTCAGGTGAFIDQMATLLDLTVEEMDELSGNRIALRRVCQDRYPALAQSRSCQGKYCRQHLCGGRQPDHRGTGAGA